MNNIRKLALHSVWNIKNWKPQLQDKAIRKEVCCFLQAQTSAFDIGIDELYCGPEHLHFLCTYPEDANITKIITEMLGMCHAWMTEKGYPEIEWENAYLTLAINETEMENERRYIREQENYHENYSSMEECGALIRRAI